MSTLLPKQLSRFPAWSPFSSTNGTGREDCAVVSGFHIPFFPCLAILLVPALSIACVQKRELSVVVYSASDREYATPILDAFERNSSGVEVVRQFDVESTKTLGLVARIEQEKDRPRCDVFWSNEILHTIRLQKQGLIATRTWKIPSAWPVNMRAKDGSWVGFAARARVLLINKSKLPDPESWPKSVFELAIAKWHNRCGLANPMYGTTATHFAVLSTNSNSIDLKGDQNSSFVTQESKLDWLRWSQAVAANAVVLSGNKQVALSVSSGELDWGLTDTDDAAIEKESGQPVEIVFPDQSPGAFGTLLIPNTVSVLKGAPHPVSAADLADYLISEQVESRLTIGNSAQFPVWPETKQKSRLEDDKLIRWAETDFEKAAEGWSDSMQSLKAIFDKN